MKPEQKTVRTSASFRGRGLHSGAQAHMVVSPGPPDSGICFRRSDLPDSGWHRLTPAAAAESDRCMTLRWTDQMSVLTPEHFLSACAGLGVSNLQVALEGPEVPILDGSATPFVEGLLQAGVVGQGQARTVLRPAHAVVVQEGGAMVLVRPAETFSVTYVASYANPHIGTQVIEYPGAAGYEEGIAPARTFGFAEEVEALRQRGLIQGGSLDCAVLVSAEGFSSPLRFADEPGRHKVLDLLGDLALLDAALCAHVVAVRSSHRLHARLVQALTAAAAPAEDPVAVPASTSRRNP